jgi:hypothetical protein
MACHWCSGDHEARDEGPPPPHDRSCPARSARPPPRRLVPPPASAAEVLGQLRHGLRDEDRARQDAREARKAARLAAFDARAPGRGTTMGL